MKKIERLKLGSVMIIIVLLVSGVFLYLNFYNQEEDIIEVQIDEKIIDNRISPYTEQAIFIEIKRVRAKGIIDQITDTGPLLKKVNQLALNNKGLDFPKLSKITGKPTTGLGITALITGSILGFGWDEKPTFN